MKRRPTSTCWLFFAAIACAGCGEDPICEYMDSHAAVFQGDQYWPSYSSGPETRFADAWLTPVSAMPLEALTQRTSLPYAISRLESGYLPSPYSIDAYSFAGAIEHGYPEPPIGQAAAVTLTATQAPWNLDHLLLRVGLKARSLQSTPIVASGAQLRVTFDPALTQSYRLVGFRTRDAYEAYDPGSGATLRAGEELTAFYEVVPVKYSGNERARITASARLRYLDEAMGEIVETEARLAATEPTPWVESDRALKLGATAIALGLFLSESSSVPGLSLDQLSAWIERDDADEAPDESGAELTRLIDLARAAAPYSWDGGYGYDDTYYGGSDCY